jgi:hypothetical protein
MFDAWAIIHYTTRSSVRMYGGCMRLGVGYSLADAR